MEFWVVFFFKSTLVPTCQLIKSEFSSWVQQLEPKLQLIYIQQQSSEGSVTHIFSGNNDKLLFTLSLVSLKDVKFEIHIWHESTLKHMEYIQVLCWCLTVYLKLKYLSKGEVLFNVEEARTVGVQFDL